jgi:drug/metabolite transporter (DMT)-like permease
MRDSVRMEPALKPRSDNVRSIAAMLAAVALFSLMDTAMKLLAAHYPAMQIAALRGLSSLPLVVAYVAWRGAFGSLLRVRWSLHLLRAVLGIVMLFLFAYALRLLPLAGAYTIFFISPLLITALSALVLKERIEAARWRAIAFGMIGVLIVLRPTGAGVFTLGGLAVLGAAACYAVSAITVSMLSRSDSGESMVFWLTLLLAIGAGALAAPQWVAIERVHWPVIAGLAVSGFLGQLMITEAFRRGEASAVAPFEYTALAWGIGLDWLLWQALPDGYTLLGAAIIIASGVYLIRREKSHAESEHP